MKKLLLLIPVVLLLGYWSYLSRDKGQPVENFEVFFKAFREHYALFEVKQIDWDKEYARYVSQISEQTTDDELYQIFTELLSKLNDKHCYIYRFNEIYFSGFGLPSLNYLDLLAFDFRLPTNDFSLKLIEKKYLKNSEKTLQVYSTLPPIGIRHIFTTGWLADSIAYIHMTEMSHQADKVQLAIRSFIENYQDARGYVIDIRDNIGGYSMPVKELAEYFTNDTNTYAISRLRSLDDSTVYQEPDYWQLIPTANSTYQQQPIALLTNQNTQSAAELFTLMMKTIPSVTIIGDTTSGIFADTMVGRLPNGWEYRLSARLTNDWNDMVLEDTGIVPDTIIINTEQDLNQETDRVLEQAMASFYKIHLHAKAQK
ncbi:S41 family peptidase [Carboxylicivirga sp. A043]|uniref:S41 family peptidase n=1 Tax=Carboxylicivirga litoralis TaxID=2816963 RepID=UPI0021CB932B|nr:S41 family peptidase [Carboxylicivirga sp. A043]MCU4158162.1 S41 family peptidase [Carboxylicivirga sp. A043]